MKLKSIFLLNIFIFLFSGVAITQNNPPVVSNVAAEQRTGTNIVDITYNVQDDISTIVGIHLQITDDGIPITINADSGDVGFNITVGENKHISWDAGVDYLDHFGNNFIVTITAYDEEFNSGSAFGPPFILDTRRPVDGWQIITDSDSTYNENILIDNSGNVWCFYLRSKGSHQPIYMKVMKSDGYIYKAEQIIGYGSALVNNEYQTIRAALNRRTGEVWVVIQGSNGNDQIGYFIIFDRSTNVKQDSTLISASNQINAPKIVSDNSGTMWFCWHTNTSGTADAKGEFISCSSDGVLDPNGAKYFTTDGNIINTDLAIDSNNRIWFIYERSGEVANKYAKFSIYDINDKVFILPDSTYSADPMPFDPRKSIYADQDNARIWILKKNFYNNINQLYGYNLSPNPLPSISEVGLCSFVLNENRQLEVVHFNPNNNTYEMSEYSPINGTRETNWTTLFNNLTTTDAISEYVAYNKNYPALKAYLVRTDSTTTKVKIEQVTPLSITIDVSPDFINFGLVGTDTLKTALVQINNTGNAPLNVTNITTSENHFTVDSTTFLIEPESSKVVQVTFSPTEPGYIEGNLTINSNADNGTQTIFLSGQGYQRTWIVSINPDSIDFGSVPIGDVKKDSFVVENVGTEILHVDSITTTDSHFTLNDNVNFYIPAADSHTITINFEPTTEDTVTAMVYIFSNADSNIVIRRKGFNASQSSYFKMNTKSDTQRVYLKGKGYYYTAPQILIEPNYIEFDSVKIDSSKTKTFTVKNIGNDTLNVTNIYSSDEHFVIGKGEENFLVVPGDSQIVHVSFTPTSVAYIKATIYVNSNDPENPEQTISVDGKGITYGNPDIYVDKSSLIFDTPITIGDSSSKFLGISNIGTNVLLINSISPTDSQFFAEYDTTQYGINPVIAPEDPIMWVTVTFKPQLEGSIEDTLVIESNDPDTPNYLIPLYGIGRSPTSQKISVQPDSLYFGEVTVTKYKQMYLTIKNVGEATLNINNIAISDSNFVITNVRDTSFSLSSQDSSVIVVQFSPDSSRLFEGILSIMSNDPIDSVLNVPLVGYGIPLADQNIVVYPENLNFGEIVLGSSSTKYLWIYNTGEKLLTVSNIISSDKHYTVSDTNFSVSPNRYKYIMVIFRPDNTIGQINAQLSILSNDPDKSTTNVNLTGAGRSLNPASIATDPEAINFGTVALSHSAWQYIKVRNTGEQDLIVSNITTNDEQFSITPKSFTVYPGSYRWLYVTFTPQVVGEVIGKYLTISSNAANNPNLNVTLSGSGRNLTEPQIFISPESYKFEEVAITKQASFYLHIKNNGEQTLHVSDITHKDSSFTVSVTNFYVNSGQTQYILIIFSPDTIKAYSDTIKIVSNSAVNDTVKVELSGKGRILYDQNIYVSPSSINFGSVAIEKSKTQPLLIQNKGEKNLIISSIFTNEPEFYIDQSNITLPPGYSRYIYITFKPSQIDTFNAEITIQSNDPDSANYEIPLFGTGRELLDPIISLNPESMNFGSVAVGDSLIKPLYVYNEGEKTLRVTSIIRSDRENFWFDVDSVVVNPGRAGVINVKFKPVKKDTFNATLTLENNTDSVAVVPLTGIGRDSLDQKISIEPDSLYFGTVAVGNENDQTVTVINRGEKLLKVNKVRSDHELFTVDSTGFNLKANAVYYLAVKFAPTAIDTFNAHLTFENNDTATQIGMSGIGRELRKQEIAINKDSLNFGSIVIGSSSQQNFQIQNIGDMTLTIFSIESSDSQFVTNVDSVSIEPYRSSVLTVTFTPKAIGEFHSILTIQNNDPNNSTLSIFMSGEGREPNIQKIAVTPNSIDFGRVTVNNVHTRSLWISNIGEDTLAVYNIVTSDTLFSVNETSFSLSKNEYRLIYVNFHPTAIDTISAFLSISSNDPVTDIVKVSLSAVVRNLKDPMIAISPDTVDFGIQPIYNKKSSGLWVQNTGEKMLQITNVVSSDSQFTVDTIHFSVEPNSNYYLPVYFEPQLIDTLYASLIIVNNDITNDSLKVGLKGIGRNLRPQQIAVSSKGLHFGVTAINRTKTDSFYISNEGEQNLEIYDITTNNNQFTISDKWFVVTPGANKYVTVKYQPTKTDTISIDLFITSNDPNNPNMLIPLTATCIKYQGPQISFQPDVLDFGKLILGSYKSLSFYVSNYDQNSSLVVSNITAGNNYYSVNPYNFVVLPNDSQLVTVTFHPLEEGTYNSNLTIVHNDEYSESSIVSIYGQAIQDVSGTNVLYTLSGWHSNGYYPFPDVLTNGPDNAWFIKDFYVYSPPDSVNLFVAFKDTLTFFMNGSLVAFETTDTLKHWTIDGINVTPYLTLGRNRVAAYVSNKAGQGGFDCVLLRFDNGTYTKIIRNDYPGHEDAIWWYYGASGITSQEPNSFENRSWHSYEFGWTGIDSIIANWNFEPGMGDVLYDESNYGRQVTLSNNISWVDGIVGRAIEFNGANDSFIKLAANINGIPQTLQLWINCYGSKQHIQSIISNARTGYYGHGMYLDTDRKLWIYYPTGTFSTDYKISPNRWYFLATQYIQDTVRVFVNNELIRSFNYDEALPTGSSYVFIGANPDLTGESTGFYGIIDELTVLNIANQTPRVPNVTSITYDNQTTGTKKTALSINFEFLPSPISIIQGTLNYGLGGASNFHQIIINRADSVASPLTVTIPADSITIKGLKCKLNLETNFGTIRYPEEDAEDSLVWVPVYTTAETASITLKSETYRMVSIPYTLDDKLVNSIFQDDLGAYSPYDWRLFQWNPINAGYVEFSTDSASNWINQSGLERGRAVWLVTSGDYSFDSGSGWSAENMDSYRIELQPGWNQIGNPFPYPISWDDVQIPAYYNISDLVYRQVEDSIFYARNWTVLKPWEGYFIQNKDSTIRTIFIPPIENNNSAVAKRQSLVKIYKTNYQDMEVLITAKGQCGIYLDRDNIVGVMKGASHGYDRYDLAEPPPIGNYIGLWIDNNKWKSYPGDYTVDIRDSGENGYIWNLIACANLSKVEDRYHLTITNVLPLPDNWKIYLFDLDLDVAKNLQQENSYSFNISPGKINKKRFKVIIGTEDFINQNSEGIHLVPLSFELFQNYPNPFNPTTTISFNISKRTIVEIYIYNVLGQRVRVLVNKAMRGGHHYIIWNGCNDQEVMVSSGLYFVQLKAEGKTAVKKMMLVR